MLDYIYSILYKYITYTNILLLVSIVLPILVMGVFWQSEARQRVFQVFTRLHRRYKKS
jgi:hypothetical protein